MGELSFDLHIEGGKKKKIFFKLCFKFCHVIYKKWALTSRKPPLSSDNIRKEFMPIIGEIRDCCILTLDTDYFTLFIFICLVPLWLLCRPDVHELSKVP